MFKVCLHGKGIETLLWVQVLVVVLRLRGLRFLALRLRLRLPLHMVGTAPILYGDPV